MTSRGFDAIVVGAGSAGCVVASRLAEDSRRSVLLLEAGPDDATGASPALREGWGLPSGAAWPFDWGFRADSPDGEGDPLRRGKVVGGTSWLTRFAVRGARADFDRWAAAGLTDWSFDDVLPWFCRVEKDAEFGDRPWHGDSGPFPITRYPGLAPSEIHAAAAEAVAASGFAVVDDLNAPGAVGLGRMPMSSAGARRVTTADAYLEPARRASNLVVRTGATVDAVTFEGGRASGVTLVDGSTVRAGTVILCAGVYGSPPILLRSGVGPAADLRALGIEVRLELPGVGRNLADHPGVDLPVGWHGTGRASPILHSLATFASSASRPGDPPDLMFWLSDPVGDDASFYLDPVLLTPRSRGRVSLRSADPSAPPRIEIPGIQDNADVTRLAEGYRLGIEIANRPELRSLASEPARPDPGSGPALREVVTTNAYSNPHVVGTCAMGVAPDRGAVVDGRGHVHGLDGLLVVDASIIPEPPSGFPQLITVMLAERLAAGLA